MLYFLFWLWVLNKSWRFFINKTESMECLVLWWYYFFYPTFVVVVVVIISQYFDEKNFNVTSFMLYRYRVLFSFLFLYFTFFFFFKRDGKIKHLSIIFILTQYWLFDVYSFAYRFFRQTGGGGGSPNGYRSI